MIYVHAVLIKDGNGYLHHVGTFAAQDQHDHSILWLLVFSVLLFFKSEVEQNKKLVHGSSEVRHN